MLGLSPPRQTLGGKGRGPHRPTYGRRGRGAGVAVRVREVWGERNENHRKGVVGSQAPAKKCALPITLPRHHSSQPSSIQWTSRLPHQW